eukprot:3031987-Alexandrium_andersonii.AAC.1
MEACCSGSGAPIAPTAPAERPGPSGRGARLGGPRAALAPREGRRSGEEPCPLTGAGIPSA